jgi:limonene-1,2-epoxide hydrolase
METTNGSSSPRTTAVVRRRSRRTNGVDLKVVRSAAAGDGVPQIRSEDVAR